LLLMEDGDPSHGMKKCGVARKLKDTNWITNLKHPAQSLDLNPMEGIWNIIKNRLRKKVYHTNKELKEAIQAEWDKITLEDIREHIRDMPRRCDLLVKTGGKAIKSRLW
jgi:transposase